MSTTRRSAIDTFAWVEYLTGSRAGAKAKERVESPGALTPSVVMMELTRWYLREIEAGRRKESEMQEQLSFVETSSEVVPLDEGLARRAGELDFLMKKRIKGWPIADSIIYATAKARSAEVVTGDPHFRGLDDVYFLGPD
ncbi:MAG TPA: type II toxin-antitoxin system VapC family toxin [Nitrososphaerales archaeon]|nr:type II toxin-antitoxin system VapC family toxin [Nitrososphaerales archaeon]